MDEALDLIGRSAIANSTRDALRLCQASRSVRIRLEAVRAHAAARRLCWLPSLSANHEISDSGRAMTVLPVRDDSVEPWVAGGLLPTTGTSTWRLSVDKSKRNDGNGIWIGVCDETATCGWGVFLKSGRLRRACRDAHGKLDFDAAPPDTLPNGSYKRVVFRDAASEGDVVEVSVDHDTGSLAFGVNGGERHQALPLCDGDRGYAVGRPRAFPRGVALRPYAAAYYPGDRLSFVAPYL